MFLLGTVGCTLDQTAPPTERNNSGPKAIGTSPIGRTISAAITAWTATTLGRQAGETMRRKTVKQGRPRPAPKLTATEASPLIDQRIRDLGGWRGETLARMRALILEADRAMTEEWKWMVPVWSHHGIVCTGEAYTKVVKLTFARGARVPDPKHLFNSSLEGNTRRAIDIREGETVAAGAFKALVKAAVAQNGPPAKKR